jgi:hypothetical protein
MGLTLAIVLTTGGAVIAAGLITGVVEILKKVVPIIGARSWEARLAFVLSLVLVVLAFASLGEPTPDGAFLAFLAWYGIARLALGIHDDVTSARSAGTD